jgi:hypothetical protein
MSRGANDERNGEGVVVTGGRQAFSTWRRGDRDTRSYRFALTTLQMSRSAIETGSASEGGHGL